MLVTFPLISHDKSKTLLERFHQQKLALCVKVSQDILRHFQMPSTTTFNNHCVWYSLLRNTLTTEVRINLLLCCVLDDFLTTFLAPFILVLLLILDIASLIALFDITRKLFDQKPHLV